MAAALVLFLLADCPTARATMPTHSGVLPAAVSQAFEAGLFALPEHAVRTGTSAVQSQWKVPVLMVGFSDAPLTKTPAEFQQALFDTTGATPSGSVSDYYLWASGGRLKLRGRVVATVNLPMPRDFYAYGFYGLSRESTPQNLYGLVRDALLSCDSTVNWSEFDADHDGFVDILWVIHQGVGGETSVDRTNLWSITSRMTGGWQFGAPFPTPQVIPGTMNQHYKVDRFSTLPELSAIIPGRRSEIGTFCHEFGHALGLPDLYDTSGIPAGFANAGPGNWSLMATGGYGGGGLTPERPSHLGAWCQLFLGWGQSIRPSEDTVVTLRPISRGDPFVEVWFQGASNPEHFLIENRYSEGFDATLPNNGLIIYHVDEAAIAQRLAANRVNAGFTPGLAILEGDGHNDLLLGLNRGDAGDPLPGSTGRTGISDQSSPSTRTFAGAYTNIALGAIQQLGQDVRFNLQVRSPGWETIRPVGSAQFTFFDSGRPGRWARTDAQRRVYHVRSEWIAGVPQVVLNTRLGNAWQPEETVSSSPVAAVDPTIAILPGGDLAVAWTDVRGGSSRIYLRERIRGAWQPEISISEPAGNSHHAAIGTDDNGMVQVAWIYEIAGNRRISFKRFSYFSPFGTPSPVTFAGESPDPPALEVRPDGASYLVWADRAGSLPRLYFARFHPDSGVSARVPLTPTPADAQLSVSAALDPAGSLHVAWQVAGSGLNEMDYQRRRATLSPAPRDTVLDSSGNLLQNPVIACDDSGGVHLVYENWTGPSAIPIYRLWTQTRGWDFGGTEVATAGVDGFFPTVLPHGPSDVTVLYTHEGGSDLQLMERRRRLGVPATVSAPPPSALESRGLRLAPNPLRAGGALRLDAIGDGESFEIFDLNGRRVAEIPARADGVRRGATVSPALTSRWADGIYFVRLRGGPTSARIVVLR